MAKLTQSLHSDVLAARVLECIKKDFKSVLEMPLDFINLHDRLIKMGFELEHLELEDALNFLVSKNQSKLTASGIRLSPTDMTRISFKLVAF